MYRLRRRRVSNGSITSSLDGVSVSAADFLPRFLVATGPDRVRFLYGVGSETRIPTGTGMFLTVSSYVSLSNSSLGPYSIDSNFQYSRGLNRVRVDLRTAFGSTFSDALLRSLISVTGMVRYVRGSGTPMGANGFTLPLVAVFAFFFFFVVDLLRGEADESSSLSLSLRFDLVFVFFVLDFFLRRWCVESSLSLSVSLALVPRATLRFFLERLVLALLGSASLSSLELPPEAPFDR